MIPAPYSNLGHGIMARPNDTSTLELSNPVSFGKKTCSAPDDVSKHVGVVKSLFCVISEVPGFLFIYSPPRVCVCIAVVW